MGSGWSVAGDEELDDPEDHQADPDEDPDDQPTGGAALVDPSATEVTEQAHLRSIPGAERRQTLEVTQP